MKIISAIIIFLIGSALTASAQWGAIGNNIFNTNAGNVGIGLASPVVKLQVSTPASDNDETVLKLGHRSNSIQVGAIIEIGPPDYSTAGVSRIIGYSNPHSTLSSKLVLQTRNGSSWNNLILDGSGNVGIGTTTPGERLTVGQSLSSGYTPVISLNELSNNGNNSMGIDFKFAGLAGFPWGATGRLQVARQGSTANFDMIFHTATSGILSEKMRIFNNGNVGIGTQAPNSSAKLDVNGNIFTSGKIAVGITDMAKIDPYSLAVNGTAIFTKAIVKLTSSWPDYVFSSEYKLPKLDSLEQFIKLNGHLPEVPKAEEVKKDGIDLGSNQALLLKKIEELTLIVIEQNKRIEKLERGSNQEN